MSMTKSLKDEVTHLNKNYFLGGSRYFAMMYPEIIKIKSTTDWDFYAQNSEKTLNELLGRGYHVKYDTANFKKNYKGDENLAKILVSNEFPEIQILLRHDVLIYKKVIDNITPEFYRDYLWKSGPNYCNREQIQNIFNQMFRIADA